MTTAREREYYNLNRTVEGLNTDNTQSNQLTRSPRFSPFFFVRLFRACKLDLSAEHTCSISSLSVEI